MSALRALVAEIRRHPAILRGIALSGSAAFGSALPDLLAFAARVFS